MEDLKIQTTLKAYRKDTRTLREVARARTQSQSRGVAKNAEDLVMRGLPWLCDICLHQAIQSSLSRKTSSSSKAMQDSSSA